MYHITKDCRETADFEVSHILVRPWPRPGHRRKVFWKGSDWQLDEENKKEARRVARAAAAARAPPICGHPEPAPDPDQLPIEDAAPDGDPVVEEDDDVSRWARRMEVATDVATADPVPEADAPAEHDAPEASVASDQDGYVSDEVSLLSPCSLGAFISLFTLIAMA